MVGNGELLCVVTDRLRVTVSGPAPRRGEGVMSLLSAECGELRDVFVRGERVSAEGGVLRVPPMLLNRYRYVVSVRWRGDMQVSLMRSGLRAGVSLRERTPESLTLGLELGDVIGMTELSLRVDGERYLTLGLEVFPARLRYREDFEEISADVFRTVYREVRERMAGSVVCAPRDGEELPDTVARLVRGCVGPRDRVRRSGGPVERELADGMLREMAGWVRGLQRGYAFLDGDGARRLGELAGEIEELAGPGPELPVRLPPVSGMSVPMVRLRGRFLEMRRFLALSGDVVEAELSGIRRLYALWAFLAFRSVLEADERLEPLSDEIFTQVNGGARVLPGAGERSTVYYYHLGTGETVSLSCVPTGVAVPETAIAFEVASERLRRRYIFCPDYDRRVEPANDSSGVFDPRLLPRDRTVILYPGDGSGSERTVERSFDNRRPTTLALLPGETDALASLVDELLSIPVPPEFGEAELPAELEEELPGVDWSRRDVMVATVRGPEQLRACLEHGFYHIPASQFEDGQPEVRYIALYQSRKQFGAGAGVRFCGRVTSCEALPRCEIKELPSSKKDIYYRYNVRRWRQLPRPIEAKEMRFIYRLTSPFLLEHCVEVPELWVESELEFRLYRALMAAVRDCSVNVEHSCSGFTLEGATFIISDGVIKEVRDGETVEECSVSDFVHTPYMAVCGFVDAMG